MENDLVQTFEKDFEKAKKELKIKTTLRELDEAFFLNDSVMKEGYVSTSTPKQICRRIMDVFGSWLNYIHGLIIINPNSMINVTESQAFNEIEKERMGKLIDRLMMFSSEFSLLMLQNDDKKIGAFIDDAFTFWKKELNPALLSYMTKTNKAWTDRFGAKPDKKDKAKDSMYG